MEIISGKIEKAKKCVLYGPEGIGKSSLAAQFPKPIFIDTEGSTTELNVDRLPKPSSWTMLNQQVDWVKQQAGRFKTLVIDTIDWAEMLCIESVCSQHNKKGIEDFGYGNGYVYTKEEFGRFLNKLSDVIDAGVNVVLSAHSQIVKFEQPDEMGAYDRYQLKLGKKTSSQTAPLVKEWADMVLFINYKTYSVATDDKGKKNKGQGGVRTIYTTHHPAWDAKNRHGLPDELPLDYASIAHIFNSSASVPTQTQSAPPPPPVQEPINQPPVQQEAAPPSNNVGNTQGAESNLNPAIPKSLRDLMQQYSVSEEEIQVVVNDKGYYPMGTPIVNYDPGFIEGVLVAAWPQVYGMVENFRKTLPF
ncbi:ATP-binding protein [Anaerobacillus isosaccharinicus]|uniref:ATP-binding protein n=1 Tax=Anaerobacillus isosaccharinicus TaxID=1532552 RepID=A0A1S2LAK3_9BACI|nr:ATP-binding protein [Anaerobacillus isosaccharinicus]MBA5584546.1 ATP-binding protein [Anaerobacillus isosaccharinicus]QOY37070.1 ATP-binding protein [Anaerobacillus isosaccharinicus]